MRAKILGLDGTEVQQDTKRTSVPRSAGNLEDLSATYLLRAVNERGQRCWFYRVAITGLYTRLFGPFTRKSEAIEGFELFLNGALQALCNCLNDASEGEKRASQFIETPSYLDGKS
jgi:hypothetical protein